MTLTRVRILAAKTPDGYEFAGVLVMTGCGIGATYTIQNDGMTFYGKDASGIAVPGCVIATADSRFDKAYADGIAYVRLYELVRTVDVTHVSGIGHVLDVLVFGDGDGPCMSLFHGDMPSGTRRDSFKDETHIRCSGGHSKFIRVTDPTKYVFRDPVV